MTEDLTDDLSEWDAFVNKRQGHTQFLIKAIPDVITRINKMKIEEVEEQKRKRQEKKEKKQKTKKKDMSKASRENGSIIQQMLTSDGEVRVTLLPIMMML